MPGHWAHPEFRYLQALGIRSLSRALSYIAPETPARGTHKTLKRRIVTSRFKIFTSSGEARSKRSQWLGSKWLRPAVSPHGLGPRAKFRRFGVAAAKTEKLHAQATVAQQVVAAVGQA
jgi:hypothetical protein